MIRVSLLSLSVILATLAVAIAAILMWLWIARRRRDQALREHGRPLLVMPMVPSSDIPLAQHVRDVVPARRSPITALAVAEQLSTGDYQMVAESPGESLATMTTGETVTGGEAGHESVAEMIQGSALRFHRPADHSRPFLPGVLRVSEGPDAGIELRFVQLAGNEPPVVTFGRSQGPPFRHVQLLEPTVSRAHARLSYQEDGWYLTNLSRTNPVLLNRIPLTDEQGTRLQDGDRIEMGALAFRYLSR
jgi:FHA domain